MITGYNTDVEHDGVVYHVQTEDKGLETPFILSLVYSGGAILASKRSRYEDLITTGFSDEALSERLKRQHLLICAAIHSGRVLDLKRMAGADLELDAVETPIDQEPVAHAPQGPVAHAPQEPVAHAPQEPVAHAPQEPVAHAPQEEEASGVEAAAQQDAAPPTQPTEPAGEPDAYTIHDPRRQSPLGDQALVEEGLKISLLEEQEFRSGDSLLLRIMVIQTSGSSQKPMNGAVVSVKVLGTAFRPMIYSTKTEKNGVATVTAQIPKFTSGRAAILVKALAGGSETELRRVIHAA